MNPKLSLALGYQTSQRAAFSAIWILVTVGLRKLPEWVGRKKRFKVSLFLDSHCISEKKLST